MVRDLGGFGPIMGLPSPHRLGLLSGKLFPCLPRIKRDPGAGPEKGYNLTPCRFFLIVFLVVVFKIGRFLRSRTRAVPFEFFS